MFTDGERTWVCCQIGAREHYAVPRALHQGKRLAALYTDFWAGSMVRGAAGRTRFGAVHSLATRFHPGLAEARVGSWNMRSLLWEAALRRQSKHGGSRGRFDGYAKVGRWFASTVRDSIHHRRDLPRNAVLFAYDTGALETFEWCRPRGICCVLGQMDPNRAEVDLVREEAVRWPGWEQHPLEVSEEYFRRREQEWALADRIVVNSEFCKQALVTQGIAPEKLFVIPLCYEPEETGGGPATGGRKTGQPLRALFLGQVILRKGIQYLIQAAQLLERENIRFDVVGPIGISGEAMASAPKNVFFHGRVVRGEVAGLYRRADVFLLPTLSDGFAMTQLEAMAHGLPVIATACCGEVVRDGVDGFVVPPRHGTALAETLQRYLSEPDLLASQRAAALVKSRQFTLERLAENLLALERTLPQCSVPAGGGPPFRAGNG